MNGYEYSKQELEQNKVLKYNRDVSQKAIESAKSTNQLADTSIESSVSMLGELGITIPKCPISPPIRIEQKLTLEKWDNIANEASQHILEDITLEDLLTKEDIDKCWEELDEISAEFSRKTSIVNKTDLSFLTVATALQVTKSLIFPYVAKQFGYGEKFDASKLMAHDDEAIKKAQ